MKAEDKVITSPLSRAVDIGGQHLVINVYKGAFDDDPWFFEILDSHGLADISQEMYVTDRDAFDAALMRRTRPKGTPLFAAMPRMRKSNGSTYVEHETTRSDMGLHDCELQKIGQLHFELALFVRELDTIL